MRIIGALSALCLLLAALSSAQGASVTFTNPLLAPGADPWVIVRDGWYYYTDTQVDRIDLRRTRILDELRRAERKTIWRAPASGPNSMSIWAPELHWVGDRWYLYYTATTQDDNDANRRIFVLESETADPFGLWKDRGKLLVPAADDAYAIDGTLHQASDGRLYFLWSGRERSEKGPQNIYIAAMENPWTLRSPRVRISTPEHEWEKHGWEVNEGPEVLERDGRLFVVYSGSGYLTAEYCLGLLEHRGGDLLDSAAWVKSPQPVFSAVLTGSKKVFGPGHCSFFKSPSGNEDWIIYHARSKLDMKRTPRDIRAQRFTWKPDGTPDFGRPVLPGAELTNPAGELEH